MKDYKIPYAAYPFNVEELPLEWETVKANTLTEAIEIVRDKYKDSVEIFETPARKHYQE